MYNPNYEEINKQRQKRFLLIHNNEKMLRDALEYYEDKPIEFIEHWGITYDHRNAGTEIPTLMPFILFPKQKEFIEYLHQCFTDQ